MQAMLITVYKVYFWGIGEGHWCYSVMKDFFAGLSRDIAGLSRDMKALIKNIFVLSICGTCGVPSDIAILAECA